MSRSLVSAAALVLVVAVAAQGLVGGAAAENVTLTIKLVDSDGNPVSNVDITVTWNGGEGGPKTETTRANGQALVDVPEGSNVEITIDDDEYVRNSKYVLFNAQTQEVEVPVSLSGTATVTVEDVGGPVSGAAVSLTSDAGTVAKATTGSNGEVATGRLERGVYDVRVSKPGYLTNVTTVNITGDVEKRVRIRRAKVEARFTIMDDHFDPSKPVPNASIEIPQLGTTITTLSDGMRTTDLPVNRKYEVTITKDGYETEERTLTVRESAVSLRSTIRRLPDLSLSVANDRVVVGETTRLTVTDEYGDRVEGATVTVAGETVGTTNAQGQLTVPVDQAGEVPIEVTGEDASASVTVEGVEASQATPTPATSPTPTATPTATPTPTPTATSTASPTPTPTSTPTETAGDGGPGFGIIVAIVALSVAVMYGRWH